MLGRSLCCDRYRVQSQPLGQIGPSLSIQVSKGHADPPERSLLLVPKRQHHSRTQERTINSVRPRGFAGLERTSTWRGRRHNREPGFGECGNDTFRHELGFFKINSLVGIFLLTTANGGGHYCIDLMLIRHGKGLRPSSHRSMSFELIRRRGGPCPVKVGPSSSLFVDKPANT